MSGDTKRQGDGGQQGENGGEQQGGSQSTPPPRPEIGLPDPTTTIQAKRTTGTKGVDLTE